MGDNNQTQAQLEHVNITVAQPKDTAAMLCRLFDWKIRWEGAAIDDGYSVHVGNDNDYVAVYSTGTPKKSEGKSYHRQGGLNHIGICVDNLEAAEQRVIAEGLQPFNHGNYTPGRRFYFVDTNDVEYEVVSYSPAGEAT